MADDGVGPSIALGNQEENGNWADLAYADSKINSAMAIPTNE